MKNTNNRRFKNLAVAAAAIAATGSVQASVIALTADAGNSTAQYNGTHSVSRTLDDGFSYNENDPTSTSPSLSNGRSAHGANGTDGVDAVFAYTASHLVTTSESTIVVDLWGRNVAQERDDNFSVQLDLTLAGGGTSTVTALGGNIPDVPAAYQRLTFTGIAVGDTITAMRIIGVDTDGNAGGNYFTIMETRLAAIAAPVPEPSSTALLGLGGLALILRRRK